MIIETRSGRQTRTWGRRLGSLLEGGELIGFGGELGVGKTCFIKGLGIGLGLAETEILSPTFTMIQEHHGRLPLFHIDLYRLDSVSLDDLGLRDYLFSEGVAAVEWFARLREADGLDHLAIRIAFLGGNRRQIELQGHGARYETLLERLEQRFLRSSDRVS